MASKTKDEESKKKPRKKPRVRSYFAEDGVVRSARCSLPLTLIVSCLRSNMHYAVGMKKKVGRWGGRLGSATAANY